MSQSSPKHPPAPAVATPADAPTTASSRDETTAELHQRTEELRAANQELLDLRVAINEASIVATTDVRGIITSVNDRFCKISGYTAAELIGQNHRILNSGVHGSAFFVDLWRTIAGGEVWRGEICNRAKSGKLYWVDTTIVPFLDSRGRPHRYLAIRTDITSRVEAQARLREQTALARLGEMASVVAHEVKNPLAGISGALQIVRRRLPADTAEHAVVGDILERITALNATMEDLLEYARPRTPKIAQVDVAMVLSSIVRRTSADPLLAGVQLLVEAQPCVIGADHAMLEGVILNLIINAAQALGGRGEIRVCATRHEDVVELSIADNGPGMTPAVRERVFEPFFTTRHRGTGLGLAIVRRVVEAHHGTVQLDSELGAGTTVTLRLPTGATPAAFAPGGAEFSAPSAGPSRP